VCKEIEHLDALIAEAVEHDERATASSSANRRLNSHLVTCRVERDTTTEDHIELTDNVQSISAQGSVATPLRAEAAQLVHQRLTTGHTAIIDTTNPADLGQELGHCAAKSYGALRLSGLRAQPAGVETPDDFALVRGFEK
jgi:hypothetical protein